MASPDPTPTPARTARRRVLLVGATVTAALVLLGAGWLAGSRDRTPTSSRARQAEVFQRGSTVMPFDQTKTTHIFKPLDDGGTQVVIADDPADQTQITLAQALANGALLRYTTRDPATLDALRAWFAAQTSDHGPDAVG